VPLIVIHVGRLQVVRLKDLAAIPTVEIFYTVSGGNQLRSSVLAGAFHVHSGYTHSISAPTLVKGHFLK